MSCLIVNYDATRISGQDHLVERIGISDNGMVKCEEMIGMPYFTCIREIMCQRYPWPDK